MYKNCIYTIDTGICILHVFFPVLLVLEKLFPLLKPILVEEYFVTLSHNWFTAIKPFIAINTLTNVKLINEENQMIDDNFNET